MKRLALLVLAASLPTLAACEKDRPETGTVTVEVYDAEGLPAEGVDVVYHAKNGGVLFHTFTDSDGVASFGQVPHDASVTIARRNEQYEYHLQTLTWVQPSSTVRFGRPAPMPAPAQLRIQMPPLHPTAKGYLVDAGCATEFIDNYTPEYLMTIDESCAPNGFVSVVVYATDDDWLIHGYSFLQDEPLGLGETVITLPDWTNQRQVFSMDVPTVPWGTIAYMRARFVAPGDSFLGDPPLEFSDYERAFVVDSTDALEGDYQLPIGYEQALGYSLEIYGDTRETFLARRDATSPVQQTIDLGKDILPLPDDFVMRIFDGNLSPISRPDATWTLPAEQALESDAVGMELIWSDGPGQPDKFRWDIAAPARFNSIQAPAMPINLVRFTPLTGDVYHSAKVWFREADFLDSHLDYFQYDQLFDPTNGRLRNFPDSFQVRSTAVLTDTD